MREALIVLAVIVWFVAVLALFLWPLRVIVQSSKVRGFRKLAWVGLWLGALLLPAIIYGLLKEYLALQAGADGLFVGKMATSLLTIVLVWAVYFAFRSRTRSLPDLESRAHGFGYAMGAALRRLIQRTPSRPA